MLSLSIPGFVIDAVCRVKAALIVDAHAVRPSARCPRCQQSSSRVHSRYIRSPRDLPVSDQRVQLRLQVRRFFCDQPACPRRTFAERLSNLVPVHARRTARLTQTLAALGFALGGRGGARVARRLHVHISRSTLLRVVSRTVVPSRPTPRVLGVDDFALRKGRVYGTILVDLEQRRPVDVLPDRDAASLETWLRAHPGVEVLTRDRSPEYTRGATAGAPDAIQVADRWHLLTNLREALERVLDRAHPHLRALAMALPSGVRETASPQVVPVRRRRRSANEDVVRAARRARRQACYEAVRTLYAQGKSMRQIAAALHLSRWLVRRVVQVDTFPERAPTRSRASKIAPFEPYLREPWQAGERNAMALWRVLQHYGYSGSVQTVRRWVQQRRQKPAPRTHPAYRANYTVAPQDVSRCTAAVYRLPAPRRLVWLLFRDPADLAGNEQVLSTMLRQDATVEAAYILAQQFLQIVRQRQVDRLERWMEACQKSSLPDLQNFAVGLKQDEAAVRAALTLPWSNGQVEGQVTRRKMLKRQMYGRAGFALLRQRVLDAA